MGALSLTSADDLLEAIHLLIELFELVRLVLGVRVKLGNALFSGLHLVFNLLQTDQRWLN